MTGQKRSLIDQEFQAKILPDADPLHQGRYRVHIPTLMPLLTSDKAIWVKNRTHSWRATPSETGIYGSYLPLQPGSLVVVGFSENNIHTGYIKRIVSDHAANSLPLKITDRDDYYQLYRTPRYNNFFAFTEDSKDQPPQSFHNYFNTSSAGVPRTSQITDLSGIHTHTDDNMDIKVMKHCDKYVELNDRKTVKADEHTLIFGNSKKQIIGTYEELINGKYNLTITGGDYSISVIGNIRQLGAVSVFIEGVSGVHIKSANTINLDAPTINLAGKTVNIGKSSAVINFASGADIKMNDKTGPVSVGHSGTGSPAAPALPSAPIPAMPNLGAVIPERVPSASPSVDNVTTSTLVYSEHPYFEGKDGNLKI